MVGVLFDLIVLLYLRARLVREPTLFFSYATKHKAYAQYKRFG